MYAGTLAKVPGKPKNKQILYLMKCVVCYFPPPKVINPNHWTPDN